jgi:hypothetical protein
MLPDSSRNSRARCTADVINTLIIAEQTTETHVGGEPLELVHTRRSRSRADKPRHQAHH